jgi:hypothetical protein
MDIVPLELHVISKVTTPTPWLPLDPPVERVPLEITYEKLDV